MRSIQVIFSHLFYPRRSNNHRPRILHAVAYAYLSVVMVAFVLGLQIVSSHGEKFGAVLGFASTITPTQVIEQTNIQRKRAGLSELTLNEQLTQAALAKAQNMMTNQYWSHVAPDGTEPWYFIHESGYQYRVAGENLARDFAETNTMVSAWMASPTHRANILSSKYSEIGIAVISGNLEDYETTLVVQMFGQPASTQTKPSIGVAQTNLINNNVVAYETQPSLINTSTEATSGQSNPDTTATSPDLITAQPTLQPRVLAALLLPLGEIEVPPLFTPLQVIKAVFLSIILLLASTLAYDAWIAQNAKTVRIVGKNLAHLFFFAAVAYLIIFFKAGIIG